MLDQRTVGNAARYRITLAKILAVPQDDIRGMARKALDANDAMPLHGVAARYRIALTRLLSAPSGELRSIARRALTA